MYLMWQFFQASGSFRVAFLKNKPVLDMLIGIASGSVST